MLPNYHPQYSLHKRTLYRQCERTPFSPLLRTGESFSVIYSTFQDIGTFLHCFDLHSLECRWSCFSHDWIFVFVLLCTVYSCPLPTFLGHGLFLIALTELYVCHMHCKYSQILLGFLFGWVGLAWLECTEI